MKKTSLHVIFICLFEPLPDPQKSQFRIIFYFDAYKNFEFQNTHFQWDKCMKNAYLFDEKV